MTDWAAWLEATGPATALRDGPYVYPLVALAHVLGIALLVGAVAVLDLRLIGVWRHLPLHAVAGPARAVAAAGVALALPSGVALLSARATDYLDNPFLAAKLVFVALALVNLALLHRSAAWRNGTGGRRLAAAGATSLVCWLGAVAAGRFIAYW